MKKKVSLALVIIIAIFFNSILFSSASFFEIQSQKIIYMEEKGRNITEISEGFSKSDRPTKEEYGEPISEKISYNDDGSTTITRKYSYDYPDEK